MKYNTEKFKNIIPYELQKEILEVAPILQAILTVSSQDFRESNINNLKSQKSFEITNFNEALQILTNTLLNQYSPKQDLIYSLFILATIMQNYSDGLSNTDNTAYYKNFICFFRLIKDSIANFNIIMKNKFEKLEPLEYKEIYLLKKYIMLVLNKGHVYIYNEYSEGPVIVKIDFSYKNNLLYFTKYKVYDIGFTKDGLNIYYPKYIEQLDGFANLPQRIISKYKTVKDITVLNTVDKLQQLYNKLDSKINDKSCPYCNNDVTYNEGFNLNEYNKQINYETKNRPKSCPVCNLIFKNIAEMKDFTYYSSYKIPNDKLSFCEYETLRKRLLNLRKGWKKKKCKIKDMKKNTGLELLKVIKNSNVTKNVKSDIIIEAINYHFELKRVKLQRLYYKRYNIKF